MTISLPPTVVQSLRGVSLRVPPRLVAEQPYTRCRALVAQPSVVLPLAAWLYKAVAMAHRL